LLACIYTDIGQIGCSRAGGSYGICGQDCNQFFNVWNFDAVKVDNCGTTPGYVNLEVAFTTFGAALVANVSLP
jgi:Alpha galactosidase A